MRYPFQSTGRAISHRNGWSFRAYMIPLPDFVPERNSRPGTRTGVSSRRGDSRRHVILWWYHVNKYRAMRGNLSELAPGRKSPTLHVNTPQICLLQKQYKLKDQSTKKNRHYFCEKENQTSQKGSISGCFQHCITPSYTTVFVLIKSYEQRF